VATTSAGEKQPALPQVEGDDKPLPEVSSPYDALPEESRSLLEKPFTGDFDEMVKRRLIRAGVVYNRTQYFIDKGVQRGISYESINLFEEELNKRLKTGLLKVHVAIVPLSRNQLSARSISLPPHSRLRQNEKGKSISACRLAPACRKSSSPRRMSRRWRRKMTSRAARCSFAGAAAITKASRA
jgi:hypothetical protein